MLDQFPNSKNYADGFIGCLASVLAQYPRQVVLKCADPLRGIVRDHDFLTIATVVAWCERETEPMRADVSREQRVRQQLADREEWLNEKPSERLKAMGEAWLNRTDPIAAQLTAHNSEEAKARKEAGLSRVQTANEAVFNRECQSSGIDPAKGVSPALLKTLRGNIPCGMADLDQ